VKRVDGAADIVDEAACLIWSELCPDTIMSDEDRTHYEAAAKAVLALSPQGAVDQCTRPHLGLATTGELLDEIRARIEMHATGGLDYRTVDGESFDTFSRSSTGTQSVSLFALSASRNEIIEECAKVCETLRHVDYPSETSEWSSGTFDCAQAIRALRTKAVTK
jgi:hypothetical protein